MSNDNQDNSERIALWLVGLVVAFVLVSVTAFVIIKQRHHAQAPVAVAAAVEEALYDAPLSGELVGVVLFAYAESAVPSEAAPELAKALAALIAANERKIVIAGFHDASGDAAKNALLAKERAKATRAALTAAGIDAGRVLLRKPESTLAEGTSEEARRVEIRLLD
ncbi:OmpA family protein [Paucibacter sp. Y2R2-4]|uniref:OmpA family protein n=1 Tax=Paucibacter sp. Y2R2-4 TaxID=2893553 RepID=UPI0021E4616F|nr:OmpA family protein [Paucibacter sp. Y2R2-4]MCV2348743.1 OmpA family protein [Paucibacter sp. Y2R2-4]